MGKTPNEPPEPLIGLMAPCLHDSIHRFVGGAVSYLYWLNEEQMARLRPFFSEQPW